MKKYCNPKSIFIMLILTITLNAPIILELLQKTVVKIPHFRKIEITTISLQIVAIIATVCSQYWIRSKEQEELEFFKNRMKLEIKKGTCPQELKPEERNKMKRNIAAERLKLMRWKRKGPMRWYDLYTTKKLNDWELKGREENALEAYVRVISPLQDLEDKLSKTICQLCGKKGHSARNCRKNRRQTNQRNLDENHTLMEETSFSHNAPPPYTEKQDSRTKPSRTPRCQWTKNQEQQLYPDISGLDNNANDNSY